MNIFLNKYLNELKEYYNIPKLQIERAVSPLLSIFIEDLLVEYLKDDVPMRGNINLVLPEFPLKKDNNQSTNIDWLLYNTDKKIFLFVELKTASSSFLNSQLDIYRSLQKKIRTSGAKFLYNDIETIREKSAEKWKYDFILDKLSDLKNYFNEGVDSEVIYLVPTAIKERIVGAGVITFSNLPEKLHCIYKDEWQQLRRFFIELDKLSNDTKTIPKKSSSDLLTHFKTVLALIEKKYKKTPELIWIGITGSGRNPNFQIKFNDGSKIPFHSSGKEFTGIKEFNQRGIKGPYKVNDILKGKTDL